MGKRSNVDDDDFLAFALAGALVALGLGALYGDDVIRVMNEAYAMAREWVQR